MVRIAGGRVFQMSGPQTKAAMMSGKMLKQNAVRSKNAKLKCHEFSTLQKCEIKMQRKISVLQYSKVQVLNQINIILCVCLSTCIADLRSILTYLFGCLVLINAANFLHFKNVKLMCSEK